MSNTQTVYMGIDPGASGGIAIVQGLRCLLAEPMPRTEKDLWNLIHRECKQGVDFTVIEKVQGYIGKQQPGSAMFKFGQNYGSVRMALVGNNEPFQEVAPLSWQKAMKISPRGKKESKTQFKNRLKAKAQQLFPKVQVTLATADAILIACYAQHTHK